MTLQVCNGGVWSLRYARGTAGHWPTGGDTYVAALRFPDCAAERRTLVLSDGGESGGILYLRKLAGNRERFKRFERP